MNNPHFRFASFINTTVLVLFFSGFALQNAHALPSFAIRDKVSCNMCHTNGSAPHLTQYGYLYRRAGFRPPGSIGNREADDKAMTFQEHMAAGVNFDYEYVTNKAPGASSGSPSANNFNVPEVEVWPVVGAFLGNFGVWSELDAVPTTSGGGGVDVSQADVRYVTGTGDLFFNFRGGIMAPEGYGASDQWFDDANIPLVDQASAYFNQDTLALPFGAMETPQLGAEFGLNYHDSHLTLGLYNGFTGITTTAGTTTPTGLTPALVNSRHSFSKDYKLQLDQFVGDIGAVTAAYYNGSIPLVDSVGAAATPATANFTWTDHYDMERLYLTWFAVPSSLDILAGGGLAKNQDVTVSPTPDGTFNSKGAFLGALWYVKPHLNLAARADWNAFNTTESSRATARGYSLQASLPYDNNMYIFRYNRTISDLTNGNIMAGTTDDLRAEWRFLF